MSWVMAQTTTKCFASLDEYPATATETAGLSPPLAMFGLLLRHTEAGIDIFRPVVG
jgi:hypothetical protein